MVGVGRVVVEMIKEIPRTWNVLESSLNHPVVRTAADHRCLPLRLRVVSSRGQRKGEIGELMKGDKSPASLLLVQRRLGGCGRHPLQT